MKLSNILVALVALSTIAGCQAQSSKSVASAGGSSASASGSKYDAGPRAGEEPLRGQLADAGEQLFKDKGCSACHAFGARLSGPDLNGVSMRRTGMWLENQILHPEVMTKDDPISRQLMGTYALQMPNLGLTPEQAQSLIEYLKHRDHDGSEDAAAHNGAAKEGE